MSKLKLINAFTLEKLLFSLGFQKVRQKGSHALNLYDKINPFKEYKRKGSGLHKRRMYSIWRIC